jgi:hypothetical protein
MIAESDKTKAWETKYEEAVKHLRMDQKHREQLEPLLNKFCYSIYSLKPICNSTIWKQSERKLPKLEVLQ